MESHTKRKLKRNSEGSAKHINAMKNKNRNVFKKGRKKVGDIEVTDGIVIKEEVEEEEEGVDLAQDKLSNYVPTEFVDIDNYALKEEHEDSVECKIEEVFLYDEQEQQRESEYSSDDSSVKTKQGKNPTDKQPHKKQLKRQHTNSHTTTNPGLSSLSVPAPPPNSDMDHPQSKIVQRGIIVDMRIDGLSPTDIARELGISRSTVYRWLERWEKEENLQDRHRPGMPRKTTAVQDQTILKAAAANPNATAVEIKETLQLNVTPRTIRMRINEARMHHETPATKKLTEKL